MGADDARATLVFPPFGLDSLGLPPSLIARCISDAIGAADAGRLKLALWHDADPSPVLAALSPSSDPAATAAVEHMTASHTDRLELAANLRGRRFVACDFMGPYANRAGLKGARLLNSIVKENPAVQAAFSASHPHLVDEPAEVGGCWAVPVGAATAANAHPCTALGDDAEWLLLVRPPNVNPDRAEFLGLASEEEARATLTAAYTSLFRQTLELSGGGEGREGAVVVGLAVAAEEEEEEGGGRGAATAGAAGDVEDAVPLPAYQHPGKAGPNGGNWRQILYTYLRNPGGMPGTIFYEDSECVVVYDGFPKVTTNTTNTTSSSSSSSTTTTTTSSSSNQHHRHRRHRRHRRHHLYKPTTMHCLPPAACPAHC